MSAIKALDKGYRYARPTFLFSEGTDWKDVWDHEYVSDLTVCFEPTNPNNFDTRCV